MKYIFFKKKDREGKFKTNLKISFVRMMFLPEYLWSSVALKGA